MVQLRKDELTNGQYYHIYSRSIAKYIIFNKDNEFDRFIQLLDLYRFQKFGYKYSAFEKLDSSTQHEIVSNLRHGSDRIVSVVAYCIMPTHIHLLLKQNKTNGITNYMSKALNSYSRYFNTRHKRIGPLWAGRFKSVIVRDDQQLLHLTRYIHLNPTSAGLVERPNDWQQSSYQEYINKVGSKTALCETEDLFDISPSDYRKFVNSRRSYQRELAQIKGILIDNYTG